MCIQYLHQFHEIYKLEASMADETANNCNNKMCIRQQISDNNDNKYTLLHIKKTNQHTNKKKN